MKPLGIAFPTMAEAASQNADEVRGLSVSERYDALLALIRTVEAISSDSPIRARQLAEHDRQKDEELQILVQAQIKGHV
jgi:hypothetical protein